MTQAFSMWYDNGFNFTALKTYDDLWKNWSINTIVFTKNSFVNLDRSNNFVNINIVLEVFGIQIHKFQRIQVLEE